MSERSSPHAGSDVDLLVVSDDLLLEQLYACVLVAEKTLGRRINPTLYTPEEFRKRRQNSSFVQKVLAGPVIPLIGTIDAEAGTR